MTDKILRLRTPAGVLLLVMGMAVAAPVGAAETPSSAPRRPLRASIASTLARMDAAAVVAPAQTPGPETTASTPSFFKTRKGAVALVLMAGITAYTIHSRISDHIHSQVR